VYHDSTEHSEITIDLYASVLTKSDVGYKILDKSTSGDAGSFAINMRYGIGA